MSNPDFSIADEVEAAIAAGSAGKCTETVERVTALFLLSAGSYNSEQIELFGDVFERLVNTIELRHRRCQRPRGARRIEHPARTGAAGARQADAPAGAP